MCVAQKDGINSTIEEETHFTEVQSPICPRVLTRWHWLIVSSNPPSLQFHSTSFPIKLFYFIQNYLKCSPVGNLMELMVHYAFYLIGETKDLDASLFSKSSSIDLLLHTKYFGWDLNHPIIIVIINKWK